MDLSNRFNKEKDGFTWEDVWFNQLNKFIDTRNKGDLDNYKIGVGSMEVALSGVMDGEYEEKKDYIKLQFNGDEIDENEYLDLVSKELVRLLARATSKKEDLSEYIENSVVIKSIVSKLKNGIGQNLMITGKMGSGKSWASLKFAEEIVKQTGGKFTNKHIVSNLEDFMQLYNDKELCPSGSVIIFEEVGVNINSKKAMSKLNIIFSDVFQTSRYKELLIIMNAPAISFLDKTPRSLLHWWLQTHKLNKNKGICEVKPHLVELDQISGGLLFPYPRLRDGQRITRLDVSVPSKELREEYEKTSRAYKDQVGKTSLKAVSSKGFNGLELEYIDLRLSGKLQKDAIDELGKSKGWARRIERQCQERGIELPETRGLNNKKVEQE